MGSPPPPNAPAPSAVTPTVGFAPSPVAAGPCGLSAGLPKLKLGVSVILPFTFPPQIPKPHVSLKFTCNPSDPIDITGGLGWGGGRAPNADPDPDNSENSS